MNEEECICEYPILRENPERLCCICNLYMSENRYILLNKTKMDITLKITRGKDQELNLTAKTMNELVDKIIEWQLWENQSLDYYKSKGNGRLQKEKESGYYYFKD